jgi:hypothetical protein
VRIKRQETRDKNQEAGRDLLRYGYWIFIDIVTLWFNDRISELLCRLLFPAFVFFCSLLWFGTLWLSRGLFFTLKPAFERQVPKSDIFLMLLPEGKY